jgi:hypothetical protein
VLVAERNSVRESGRRRIAGSGMGRCLRLPGETCAEHRVLARRGSDERCAWPDLAVRATAGRNLHQALAGVRVVSDAGRADLAGGVPDGEFSGVGLRRSGVG